jgi:hypothetical protein
MGLLVGVDPDDFTGHERLIATLQEDREFEGKTRVADPRHACADVQLPVEPDWRLVFNDRLDDVEILARLLGVGILIVAERAKILGDGGVEIGQVMRVEDNALAVDLGIAHPERVKEPELLA